MLLSKNCYNKSFMFNNCSSLLIIKFINNNDLLRQKDNKNEINDYYEWNTKISAINEIFSNCSSLILLPDISKWDTSNIFDMSKMFYNCKKISFLSDISKWVTRNVFNMNKIFYKCSSLLISPEAYIYRWNLSNVFYINELYDNSLSLSELPHPYKRNNDNMRFITKDYNSLKPTSNIYRNEKKNINMNIMLEKSCTIFKLI